MTNLLNIFKFKRESVNPKGMGIVEVVYHPKYGIGSYQPSDWRKVNKSRAEILFMSDLHLVVNRANLYTTSRDEKKKYWCWFNRTQD